MTAGVGTPEWIAEHRYDAIDELVEAAQGAIAQSEGMSADAGRELLALAAIHSLLALVEAVVQAGERIGTALDERRAS